jgi:hypothetical protein
MTNNSSTTTAGSGAYLAAARALIGAVAVATTIAAQAHSPVPPASIGEGHPTGHVHDRSDITWPPQPRGITNVVPLGSADSERLAAEARERRAAAHERIASRRAEVRQALGDRFTRATFVEGGGKSGAPDQLVYFSYANNATVEVTFEGQRVRKVTSIPPAEYQPEITDGEIAEAEAIARAHFSALDADRVAKLQAFGILAYRPQGKGFYDTRVLYISFHRDGDSPPEYVAWVDLTQRRVLRSREEQQP